MNTVTKRAMEIVTLLVLLFFLFISYSENRIYQAQRQQQPEAKKLFYTALYNRYGSGSVTAYRQAFPDKPNGEVDKLTQTLNTIRAINPGEDFAAVPEAPPWFHQMLNDVEPILNSLHETMNQGIYLLSPEEIEAGVSSVDNQYINYQNAAKAFRAVALREWSHGRYENAIKHMTDIHRLGLAFKADPILIAHLIAIGILNNGVKGWESIVLSNPAPEWNRKILDSLQSVKPEEWNFPPYLLNSLVDYLLQEPEHGSQYKWDDWLSYARMLQHAQKQAGNPELDSLMKEYDIIPNEMSSPMQIAARLDKWTSLPALRKRIRRLPEEFYQSDPLFTASEARLFPAVHYVSGRLQMALSQGESPVDNPSIFLNSDIRLQTAAAVMQTLISTFWVRVYRDEHGQWPTMRQFKTESPYKADISLVASGNPKYFVDWVVERNQLSNTDKPNTNVLIPSLETPIAVPVKYPVNIYPDEEFRPSYVIPDYLGNIRDATATYQEWKNWTQDIINSSSPAIQRFLWTEPIRYAKDRPRRIQNRWAIGYDQGIPDNDQDGLTDYAGSTLSELQFNYLEVWIAKPQISYWVTHPGPDKIYDGPEIIFNPSNGLTSRGDIVQLAGWE